MTVHSLVTVLEDSSALLAIAERAGITAAQARLVAAALGDLPAEQVVRLCGVARADRVRQINRGGRK